MLQSSTTLYFNDILVIAGMVTCTLVPLAVGGWFFVKYKIVKR